MRCEIEVGTLGDVGFIVEINFHSGGGTATPQLTDGNQIICLCNGFTLLLLLTTRRQCGFTSCLHIANVMYNTILYKHL